MIASTEERVMRSMCAVTSMVRVTAGSATTWMRSAKPISWKTVESEGNQPSWTAKKKISR